MATLALQTCSIYFLYFQNICTPYFENGMFWNSIVTFSWDSVILCIEHYIYRNWDKLAPSIRPSPAILHHYVKSSCWNPLLYIAISSCHENKQKDFVRQLPKDDWIMLTELFRSISHIEHKLKSPTCSNCWKEKLSQTIDWQPRKHWLLQLYSCQANLQRRLWTG